MTTPQSRRSWCHLHPTGHAMPRRMFLAAIVALTLSQSAIGQTCASSKMRAATFEDVVRAVEGSDQVFLGTISKLEEDLTAKHAHTFNGRATFAIERAFKGSPDPKSWYRIVNAQNMCPGWYPAVGLHAIFFVRRTGEERVVAPMINFDNDVGTLHAAMRRIYEKNPRRQP